MSESGGHAGARSVSGGLLRPSPLDEAPQQTKGRSLLAGAGAVVAHGAVVLLVTSIGAGAARQVAPPSISELIEVELPAPEPPPEPVEPAEAEPPPPEPQAVQPRKVRRAERPAPEPKPEPKAKEGPPPEAAQAGAVLEAPEEVIDFGNTIVAGGATHHAGGTTESGGTATRAVRHANARASGVPGGTGTDPRGDRSRAPRLAGGARWDCPFPEEAEHFGIDRAVVTLRVEVGADGEVVDATVTRDPGDGFGREARRCALRKRWSPGLDRAGNPIRAIALVNVRFER